LANSDIYRQYRIGLWVTRYDIKPIISTDIGDGIANMADIATVNARYGRY